MKQIAAAILTAIGAASVVGVAWFVTSMYFGFKAMESSYTPARKTK